MSDILRDFDKKNEIPKVKIPKFATGGICNDAIFPKIDAFSQIEKIAKDIAKRQDNAMAMEFTKCIGELLKKNGVFPEITEYTNENMKENSIEHRYGATIDKLDFSEHDKVFEDKIASLEKELLSVNGEFERQKFIKEMADYERQELKQRIAELESKNEQLKHDIDKMAASKSKWIDRAVEWQQKCEKLENKETEKPTKINLNDRVKVKLTPLGAEIYYHQYDEVNKQIKENGGMELEPIMPQIDKDGYTEFQLHHFISLYGEHIGMCKPNVIEPLDIIVVK